MGDSLTSRDQMIGLAAQIVASYVGNHTVSTQEIPQLMTVVYQGLMRLGQEGSAERPEPAVSPKKSIFPDYIVCLEDGKKLKMLRRHLKTAYNMTPEQYRERWSLPLDYPMVAPNYARQRSKLAKQIGLGTVRRETSSRKAA